MRLNSLYHPEIDTRHRGMAKGAIGAYRRWYVFEGLLFIVMGVAAMMMPGATALTTEVLVGVLLVACGLVRFANGVLFPRNRWRRIISGLALALAGVAMLFWPVAGLTALVAFLGVLLLVEGVMEIAMAAGYHPARRWSWLLFSGIISMFLGGFILTHGMTTGIIFIAFIIGFSLALYGISLTTVALHAE